MSKDMHSSQAEAVAFARQLEHEEYVNFTTGRGDPQRARRVMDYLRSIGRLPEVRHSQQNKTGGAEQ